MPTKEVQNLFEINTKAWLYFEHLTPVLGRCEEFINLFAKFSTDS